MKPIFCTQKDHKDNQLNLFCFNNDCGRRGLTCSFCLLQAHKNHVQDVIPIKTIIHNLNKANNPKNQQELQNKWNAIFEKHHQFKQTFRQNLFKIKDQLKILEKEMEREIKLLDLEADLFVGDAFEKSIEILNREELNKELIEGAIEKIEPLLKIAEGHIWILRDTEINQETSKLMKTSEIIERETKYWLEKCLEDLQKLEQFTKNPHRKQVQIHQSQNRFHLEYDQWNLKETEALSFKSKRKHDLWLSGLGVYEVTALPENGELSFLIEIFQGQELNKDAILYSERFQINNGQNVGHIERVYFKKAIRLEYDKLYTVALTPSQSCLSYYGTNGMNEIDEFKFFESQPSEQYKDCSSSLNQGVIPVLLYEE